MRTGRIKDVSSIVFDVFVANRAWCQTVRQCQRVRTLYAPVNNTVAMNDKEFASNLGVVKVVISLDR